MSVQTIIDRFGGLRPLARGLDISPSVVQGWKRRDIIPAKRQQDLLKLARDKGVSLQPADFFLNEDADA